ncbi:hypothetical protein ACUWCL_28100 [Klebsiella pneumoniae]|uniref:hypothetical protein n=1 Tax=Klebsiella pneumoniae TaxID=573 RepID=UPI00405584EF
MDIANKGKEPTFITANRQEVLDITIVKPTLRNDIIRWKVSSEVSLSDHRYLEFDIETDSIPTTKYRAPKLMKLPYAPFWISKGLSIIRPTISLKR